MLFRSPHAISLALFGPSSEIAWGPWQVPQRVVTSTHSCRPCGLDGCGGGKVSECITMLPVTGVHDALRALISETETTPTLASLAAPKGGAAAARDGPSPLQ